MGNRLLILFSSTFRNTRNGTIQSSNLDRVIKDNNKVLPTCIEFTIPFSSHSYAETAYNSLKVDSEPKRGSTLKSLSLEGNKLKVSLKSNNTRQLRTALNSFLDL